MSRGSELREDARCLGQDREPDRRHDPGSRRREASHADICAEKRGREAAVSDRTFALRIRQRPRRALAQRSLQGTRRRRLHFRFSGYSRALPIRRPVRHEPPGARSKRSPFDRRRHRYLRHHRVAAQKCSQQQRPRRNSRHLLRRMAHRDGADGAASRAQGRQRAGFARGYVPGRRLSSQRGVPAELRIRIRVAHGNRQDPVSFRSAYFRHLRVVPFAGTAFSDRSTVFSRRKADLEQFRQSSQLRYRSGNRRP